MPPSRRTLLAAVPASFVLAGCTGSASSDDPGVVRCHAPALRNFETDAVSIVLPTTDDGSSPSVALNVDPDAADVIEVRGDDGSILAADAVRRERREDGTGDEPSPADDVGR